NLHLAIKLVSKFLYTSKNLGIFRFLLKFSSTNIDLKTSSQYKFLTFISYYDTFKKKDKKVVEYEF
ncbi:MAG: hypothetical protein LBH46_00555, partial [Rickettsiales bacterium]|nr:hypothetical protein [Rickettsiales bacterium]